MCETYVNRILLINANESDIYVHFCDRLHMFWWQLLLQHIGTYLNLMTGFCGWLFQGLLIGMFGVHRVISCFQWWQKRCEKHSVIYQVLTNGLWLLSSYCVFSLTVKLLQPTYCFWLYLCATWSNLCNSLEFGHMVGGGLAELVDFRKRFSDSFM